MAALLCCLTINTAGALETGLSLSLLNDQVPKSYAMTVSPSQELWLTHRTGSVGQYDSAGNLQHTYQLNLSDLYYAGQGGLLDLAFHPNFDQNDWLYLSYSFGDASLNGLKIVRVKLSKGENKTGKSVALETIFEQQSLRDTAAHYGARMAFMPDGSLLVTTGDGFNYREQAQMLNSQIGKTLRLTDTGGIPNDNPFFNAESEIQKQVYSLGHRNPQGLIVLPNGKVVGHEHGPAGGDEINFIKPGNNYGWPVVTDGKDYIGGLISPFKEYPGMQTPNYNWTPSIAPAGLIYYEQSKIAQFQNRLVVTSLKYKQLHSVLVNGEKLSDEKVYFENSKYRMRDIAQTNDGRVFVLSDSDPGHILEIIDRP